MSKKFSKITVYFWAILLLVVIGFIDYLTGSEIRVFPLYFIPLMFVASQLGKIETLLFSLLATITWLAAMYFAGREYPQSFVWVVNFFTQGLAFVIVAMMYANLTAALKREKVYSRTDALTGLLNSRCFYEESSAILNLCNRNILPITLAYIDLDNFKQANDTLGHAHGDKLLAIVSGIFKKNLRSCDLVARMGGDEFAFLLPTITATGAYAALEKIRKLIEESPDLAKTNVTVSIGSITSNKFPNDLGILIKAADELMYKVKKKGKNHVIVEDIEARSLS
jgi:diguanylate cyclase (GGDEF)-like protein